jgi:putative copper export protein
LLDILATLAKAGLYAGLLSTIGAVLVEFTLPGTRRSRRHLAGLRRRGALVTIVAAIAGAVLLILRLGGFGEASWIAAFFSPAGAATALQLAGALLLLVSGGDDLYGRLTRLSEAVLLILSLAAIGHAATMGFFQAGVDALHVAAAAWWFGSLWSLRHALRHARSAAAARQVMNFSRLAVRIVALLAVFGTMLVIAIVDFAAVPILTGYVKLLALKIGMALGALAIAAYNRLRLTPFVARVNVTALRSLRRLVDLELVVIGIVLLVTATLSIYVTPY